MHVQSFGLKTSAPVLPQVLNPRLFGPAPPRKQGGAAGWSACAPTEKGVRMENLTFRRLRRSLLLSSTIAGVLLVSACGGGGVNSPGSTAPPSGPTPTPTPSPSPSPTPTPTSAADTAEYKASGAAAGANAAYAFDHCVTGKGVTVAILDTGIDQDSAEFAGRISAESTGFEQKIARCETCDAETIPAFPIDDEVGHGTEVASVAAAAANGSGTLGVAPDATILALKIVGPDLSNVSPGSGPVPEGRDIEPSLIAPAIGYAVDHGAFAINLSGNGGGGDARFKADLTAAMDKVRAADDLVVESVSNFTDEDSYADQWAEALLGDDKANKDWFLFAIGVDANGQARAANGNAGPLADRMLAAVANGVKVLGADGKLVTETGNSFAAPAVAGAAALLKQYWPQLGGKAISEILLDTATDAGAPGVDPVYGAGILNVAKAMQAQAPPASFKAAAAVMTRYTSLSLSSPFGGAGGAAALNRKLGQMTVFDRYGRDYRMSGTAGVGGRSSGLLVSLVVSPVVPSWSPPPMNQALALADLSDPRSRQLAANRPAIASFSPARGQVVTITANSAIEQGVGLTGTLLRTTGEVPVGTSANWSISGWRLGFSQGHTRDGRTDLSMAEIGTPWGLAFGVSQFDERGRALGMRGGSELAIDGAHTLLTSVTLDQELAGFALSARAMMGSTEVHGGSALMRFDGPVLSSAFALRAAHRLFGGDVSLGLSSPLRVERARATMLAPIAFDLISGAYTIGLRRFDLSPTAREKDVELGWVTAFGPTSSLRFGVAQAFDAGHVAGARDTAGYFTLIIR